MKNGDRCRMGGHSSFSTRTLRNDVGAEKMKNVPDQLDFFFALTSSHSTEPGTVTPGGE